MDRDTLFYRFVSGVILIMLLYGAGMFIVIVTGEHALALRMLNVFATMFAGLLGLGSGYLLGQYQRGNGGRRDYSHDRGAEQ